MGRIRTTYTTDCVPDLKRGDIVRGMDSDYQTAWWVVKSVGKRRPNSTYIIVCEREVTR